MVLSPLTHPPSRSLPFHRFCETLRLAKQGDANQMELLAQMLHEGYGCLQDEEKARASTHRASGRKLQHPFSGSDLTRRS